MSQTQNLYKRVKTPLGNLYLVLTQDALSYCYYENQWRERKENLDAVEKDHKILLKAEKQLNEYFQGKRQEFDLPMVFEGTEFQKKVWKSLTKIPYGKTKSYLDQARGIKKPESVRAVANANGKNKLSIFVPCHRVIGKDGSLTGYAAGVDKKEALLKLEQGEVSSTTF